MKNQPLDLKISLTHFSIVLVLSLGVFSIILPTAFAQVFIPSHEYLAYFDSEGIYTVVGNVKNQNPFAVIPIITISVKDDENIYSKTIQHVPLASEKEIPFKIKFFEVTGNTPVLIPAKLSYEQTIKEPIPIEILYDATLIKHKDGHITGRFQNTGQETIFYPKIYAVVHGYERVLDIVQNLEYFEKIEPGEILDFSMYPDPSVNQDVFYYSCFAPVDTTVVPVTTKKEGKDFDFRYDSGAWYYGAEFDEEGTTFSMRGYNSYPWETYVNFEFAPISGNEKFDVIVNEEPIDFIQSKDEMGFWHVAFNVGPTQQSIVKITGFEKGLPPEIPKIPSWLKLNAEWWVDGQISDSEFLEGIDFLFSKGVIFVAGKEINAEETWSIPSWYKTTATWWAQDKITDDEFLSAIENLVTRGIIVI